MKITGNIVVRAIDPITKKEIDKPISNTIVVFTNTKGVVINSTVTNDKGLFTVDLPNEEYSVQAYVVGSQQDIVTFRQGDRFKVDATTVAGTSFNLWLNNKGDISKDPLVDYLEQLSKETAENARLAKQSELNMTENGYVDTKRADLSYLFGSPKNGKYYTVDNDPNFIGMTPENRSVAYVEVINSYHTTGIYIKLVWTYSTQSKKTYEIRKEDGVWQAPIEVLKGESIGDAGGAVLKEGALGFASSKAETVGNASDLVKALSKSGIYQIFYNAGTFNYGCALNLNYSHSHKTMFGVVSVSRTTPDFLADHYINGSLASSSLFYTSGNTKKDKNNVLHATTVTPKDTLLVGDGGWMGSTVDMLTSDSDASINMSNRTGIIRGDGTSQTSNVQRWGGGIQVVIGSDSANNKVVYRYQMTERGVECLFKSKNFCVIHTLYSDKNTTVDSNGFIKKASPIIKLFDDHIEWNQDFKEDPIFEKIAAGTYKISNTHGLAREGWTYEKPRGKDGNTYFKIKVQKLDDGCIISVHDYFVDYENVTIIDDVGNKRTVKKQIEVLSQARDIKANERWIDLRFFEKTYSIVDKFTMEAPYKPENVKPYIKFYISDECLKEYELLVKSFLLIYITDILIR